MKGVALVCEYNPYHNGHKFQTEYIKKLFPDQPLVCIMSGNFVQRGGPAIADKYRRAEAACLEGADLVLELIYPFSMSSAESFASSSVSIIHRLGGISEMVFGSECGDTVPLYELARFFVSEEYEKRITSLISLHPHLSYPVLRAKCTEEAGLDPGLISTSNNILAVEYLKALIRRNASEIKVHTHKRAEGDGFLSASEIRESEKGKRGFFMPDNAREVFFRGCGDEEFPCDLKRLDSAVLHTLRRADPETLSETEACNGLEHLLVKRAMEAKDTEELIASLTSKNHPASRVRRAVYHALLGTKREYLSSEPLYTNVLAANERGRDFLSSVRRTSDIRIFTKPAQVLRDSDEKVRAQGERALLADSTYAIAMNKGGGYFLNAASPYIKKD